MLYMQAVQSGVSALELATTGSNAQTRSSYNAEYAKQTQAFNVRQAKHTAELNLAAIQMDKITSNTQIGIQQDHARAAALVSAATAGVTGGSVNDVLYETDKNEAMALNANQRRADQASEQQLAAIGSQTSALLAVERSGTDISTTGAVMQGLSSFDRDDLKNLEAMWSN